MLLSEYLLQEKINLRSITDLKRTIKTLTLIPVYNTNGHNYPIGEEIKPEDVNPRVSISTINYNTGLISLNALKAKGNAIYSTELEVQMDTLDYLKSSKLRLEADLCSLQKRIVNVEDKIKICTTYKRKKVSDSLLKSVRILETFKLNKKDLKKLEEIIK